MTSYERLPHAIVEILQAAPSIPDGVAIARRDEGDIGNDVDAALSSLGLCAHVMPPVPTRVEDLQDTTIFFSRVAVKIRCIETQTMNPFGIDVYTLAVRVMQALQGTNPDSLLADSLQLTNPPIDLMTMTKEGDIVLDVAFGAAMQLHELSS